MNSNQYDYYTNLLYSNMISENTNPYCHISENNSEKPWIRASKNPNLIVKGTELFVGNLSTETNEEDLFEVFRECGEVIDVSLN
jgi:RNA recognition motif-containing protein